MSSWISVIIIWIVFALIGSSNAKKKKAEAERQRKLAQEKARAAQAAENAEAGVAGPEPQSGQSLWEYRERYSREQQAKTERQLQAEPQKPPAPHHPVQPTLQTREATVQPTLQTKEATVHPTVAQGQPAAKARHDERCALDLKAEKPVVVNTAAPPLHQHLPQKRQTRPVNLAAALQNRGYTPVQQGLIWAEVLGTPKSIAGRAGRNF